MVVGGEEEDEIALGQFVGHGIGFDDQRKAQGFHGVGAAAGARYGPIAVLDDLVPQGGEKKGHGGGAVKRTGIVPAGAAGVDARAGKAGDEPGFLQRGGDAGGDFHGGFALGLQAHEKGADAGGGHFPGIHGPEGVGCQFPGQIFAGGEQFKAFDMFFHGTAPFGRRGWVSGGSPPVPPGPG